MTDFVDDWDGDEYYAPGIPDTWDDPIDYHATLVNLRGSVLHAIDVLQEIASDPAVRRNDYLRKLIEQEVSNLSEDPMVWEATG